MIHVSPPTTSCAFVCSMCTCHSLPALSSWIFNFNFGPTRSNSVFHSNGSTYALSVSVYTCYA